MFANGNILQRLSSKVKQLGADPYERAKLEEVPIYPPKDVGLPAIPPSRILGEQSEIIRQIRRNYSPGKSLWEEGIEPFLNMLVELAHLLPASENQHHAGAGGLFRHSLEVGLHALKLSISANPFGNPVEKLSQRQRKLLFDQWQLNVLIGAMSHDLGKLVTDIIVFDRSNPENQWRPFEETLWAWIERNRVHHYLVTWRPNRVGMHDAASPVMLMRYMPDGTRVRLYEHDIRSMIDMFSAVGDYTRENWVSRYVREADHKSTRDDKPLAGLSVSKAPAQYTYIVSAMRDLYENHPSWRANERGGRIFVLKEGVFIVWAAAVNDIIDLLSSKDAVNLPNDRFVLAEMLFERELAIPMNPDNLAEYFWPVAPSVLSRADGSEVTLKMLKLAKGSILFGDHVSPAPIDGIVKVDRDEKQVEPIKNNESLEAQDSGAKNDRDERPFDSDSSRTDELSDMINNFTDDQEDPFANAQSDSSEKDEDGDDRAKANTTDEEDPFAALNSASNNKAPETIEPLAVAESVPTESNSTHSEEPVIEEKAVRSATPTVDEKLQNRLEGIGQSFELAGQGDLWRLVVSHLESENSQVRVLVCSHQNHVLLRHPTIAEIISVDPHLLIEKLTAQQLLDSVPRRSMMYRHDIAGAEWLMLNGLASETLLNYGRSFGRTLPRAAKKKRTRKKKRSETINQSPTHAEDVKQEKATPVVEDLSEEALAWKQELDVIYAKKDLVRPSEIISHMTKQGMASSGLIKKLEKLGLVKRVDDGKLARG